MKSIKLATVLLFLSLAIFFQDILAQDNSASSEENYLSSSEDILRKDVDSKLKLYDKIEEDENSAQQIRLLKDIGKTFYRLGDFDSAIFYYKTGMGKATLINAPDLYSSLTYNLSFVYLSVGKYQKALDYALISLKNDRELNNQEGIASSLNSIALIYQEWGVYDKALDYRLQSIKISEEIKNEVEIAHGNYNLGNIYRKLNKPEKALQCFLFAELKYKSLLEETPDDVNLKHSLSECIYSIGGIFLNKQEYMKALSLFHEALKIKTLLNDKVGIGNCYSQIGSVNYLQNNFEDARQNFFLSLQYKNLVNDQKGIALIYNRIGNLYFAWNKFPESESFIEKSIVVANQVGDKEILRENYRILYQIYNKKKKYRDALSYHTIFKAYTDSILNENTTKIVEELSVRFETDKKEKENLILSRENDINALIIQKQKSFARYMIGVIILILFIVIILYVLYRSKRKTNKIISSKNLLLEDQNKQIAEQKTLIEDKNRNMTDSIMYAQRIQEAMLADLTEINTVLDDAFILFKPKDIVSGDFYWFGKHENKFIISAIDCTGHGVPGAFMSMLGNSFLNQIILNEGVTSPEIILDKLSKEVQDALKQAETNNKDGMDMALCSVDLQSKFVEFAGAKNPLVYIQNGVAERIKGEKMPIGISHYENASFQKHKIETKEPTYFYMFSDGYADQFGGPRCKKFMIKNLQNMLLDIHQRPMREQKEILNNTIEEWMKNEEQIDDILVVGFKVWK